MSVAHSADGGPSERHLNYPPDALKEALANAVYHKGYDEREPIEVRVPPDRIEILSHPGADRSISLSLPPAPLTDADWRQHHYCSLFGLYRL